MKIIVHLDGITHCDGRHRDLRWSPTVRHRIVRGDWSVV